MRTLLDLQNQYKQAIGLITLLPSNWKKDKEDIAVLPENYRNHEPLAFLLSSKYPEVQRPDYDSIYVRTCLFSSNERPAPRMNQLHIRCYHHVRRIHVVGAMFLSFSYCF